MGPKGFWIALAIVLFYLVSRPHIGTIWNETVFLAKAGLAGKPETLQASGPYYRSSECQEQKVRDQAENRDSTGPVALYNCDPHLTLLWGW